jgi:2-methylaconitate cis-trans-isomerase PrpF
MNRAIPCVLMRAGTSRGPFFLREWLPADDRERDEALIGAIGASDCCRSTASAAAAP